MLLDFPQVVTIRLILTLIGEEINAEYFRSIFVNSSEIADRLRSYLIPKSTAVFGYGISVFWLLNTRAEAIL